MRSHGIINAVVDQLFKAEHRRLNKVIVELNRENKRLQQATIDGFTYMGRYILPKNVPLTVAGPGQRRTVLHPSLWPKLEAYERDLSQVDMDFVIIRQVLFSLVNPCNSQQELRDALPECVIDCLPELVRLQRMDEPARVIRNNERALRQYEKILPRMEIYSAARLIY